MKKNESVKTALGCMIGYFMMVTVVLVVLKGIAIYNDNKSPSNNDGNYFNYDNIYSPSDRNCDDFSSSYEAQKFYEANGPSDPHDLDRDGDGKACDWGTN